MELPTSVRNGTWRIHDKNTIRLFVFGLLHHTRHIGTIPLLVYCTIFIEYVNCECCCGVIYMHNTKASKYITISISTSHNTGVQQLAMRYIIAWVTTRGSYDESAGMKQLIWNSSYQRADMLQLFLKLFCCNTESLLCRKLFCRYWTFILQKTILQILKHR